VDTTLTHFARASLDSVVVEFSGVGADGGQWFATHGTGSWLTLIEASGTGDGVVRWSRDASDLAVGVYVDTIVVSAPGAQGDPATVIDSLHVTEAMSLATVIDDFLSGTGLSAFQRSFLDKHGNADGVFNAGDVLAWLDRCRGSASGGCVDAGAAPGGGGR